VSTGWPATVWWVVACATSAGAPTAPVAPISCLWGVLDFQTIEPTIM